jgi:hypothetical protein
MAADCLAYTQETVSLGGVLLAGFDALSVAGCNHFIRERFGSEMVTVNTAVAVGMGGFMHLLGSVFLRGEAFLSALMVWLTAIGSAIAAPLVLLVSIVFSAYRSFQCGHLVVAPSRLDMLMAFGDTLPPLALPVWWGIVLGVTVLSAVYRMTDRS